MFIGRTTVEAETPILWPPDVKEELTHLKRFWCWERLKAGGEGDDRGWDGWMASLTQWTWVWVNSRSWWWTGRPAVLQSMGSQRVRHNWTTDLNFIISEGRASVWRLVMKDWRVCSLPWSQGPLKSIANIRVDGLSTLALVYPEVRRQGEDKGLSVWDGGQFVCVCVCVCVCDDWWRNCLPMQDM